MEFVKGDRVAVMLPAGEYRGTVKRVRQHYLWTEDTWYEVVGQDPKPFVTTARQLRRLG